MTHKCALALGVILICQFERCINMFTEDQAKEILLIMINDRRANEPPFEITSIRLSERKDFWIMQANVIEPYPKYAGVYGYLLNNKTGEIIVCGADQEPDNYIQDLYDIQEAGDSLYVLSCAVEDSKIGLLNIKKVFDINYKQAIKLLRTETQWLQGKKRHLLLCKKFFDDLSVETSLELVKNPNALVLADDNYVWRHGPVKALNKELNITIKGSG